MSEASNGLNVVKSLKRIMHAIKYSMDKEFKHINITAPQGMLIGTLMHFDKIKISDLSEKLGLTNSTVSGIIDRLENQGCVKRIRSEEDRRIVYVSITPEFKKHTQEHYKRIEKKYEDLIKEATPEEIEAIKKGLETLELILERQKMIRSECEDV